MSKAKRSSRKRAISPVHPHAAAIDIGATLHVAAVGPDRDPEPVRSFGTFTGDLHRLADWLKQCRISTVAMESTGVYWIPAFEIREQLGLPVALVAARRACARPKRSDRHWSATTGRNTSSPWRRLWSYMTLTWPRLVTATGGSRLS